MERKEGREKEDWKRDQIRQAKSLVYEMLEASGTVCRKWYLCILYEVEIKATPDQLSNLGCTRCSHSRLPEGAPETQLPGWGYCCLKLCSRL